MFSYVQLLDASNITWPTRFFSAWVDVVAEFEFLLIPKRLMPLRFL